MAFNITIDQEEIETAIQNHVRSKVSIAEGQHVSIEMKAGRGENGFSATISIGDTQSVKEADTGTAVDTAGQTVAAAGTTRVNGKPVKAEKSDATVEEGAIVESEVTPKTGAKLFGNAPSGRNIDESNKSE